MTYIAICLLCNTGPAPLENHKATKPTFNVELASVHDDPLQVLFESSNLNKKVTSQSWTPSDKTHATFASLDLRWPGGCSVKNTPSEDSNKTVGNISIVWFVSSVY